MSMQVTILRDGDKLLWACCDCDAMGHGSDAMFEHLHETGHEWVLDLGRRPRTSYTIPI